MSAGEQIDRDFSEVENWAAKTRLALETWAASLETTLEEWATTVELAGAADAAVAAHEAAADPHPTYLTQAEADALYEVAGAVATHEAAADPHPTYLTQAEADALYLGITALNRIATLNAMSGGI